MTAKGAASVRELRHRVGKVLDRVAVGERVTITRDGKQVARFEPLARGRLGAEALVDRFRQLPEVDPGQLRQEVDAVLDQRL